MKISIAERRQIENEMIFRRVNETVIQDLMDLDEEHKRNKQLDLLWDQTILLRFQCECSDESCKARVPLTLKDYQEIHLDRDMFIVRQNHEIDSIERVIVRTKEYTVVRKNNRVAEPKDKSHKSKQENSKVIMEESVN
jgi:hypothetical protein